LAAAVLVPTKFESLSLPVWEAFAAGTPVACSRINSLPEQVDGAGLLFDPDNPREIASAVRRLWEDETLRADLVRKGFESPRLHFWRFLKELRSSYLKV